MATREITDEQAGEIAERLEQLSFILQTAHETEGFELLHEIRRLLGFPA